MCLLLYNCVLHQPFHGSQNNFTTLLTISLIINESMGRDHVVGKTSPLTSHRDAQIYFYIYFSLAVVFKL